jgi:hypothetical protein
VRIAHCGSNTFSHARARGACPPAGAVTIRAASQPCVPPAAPLQPGRFAGATENGLFLASPNPTNQFDPRAGRTPDTLNTGNLFRNSGLNSPNDIAISDTLVEFGSETSFPITGGGTGYQRVCLDTTTDGLVTLSTSQSQDTVFPASTFRLSSSRFAGCTLRFNGGSYPTMPSGVIDSQGNLDITLPQALVATGQANWNIVSCPGECRHLPRMSRSGAQPRACASTAQLNASCRLRSACCPAHRATALTRCLCRLLTLPPAARLHNAGGPTPPPPPPPPPPSTVSVRSHMQLVHACWAGRRVLGCLCSCGGVARAATL